MQLSILNLKINQIIFPIIETIRKIFMIIIKPNNISFSIIHYYVNSIYIFLFYLSMTCVITKHSQKALSNIGRAQLILHYTNFTVSCTHKSFSVTTFFAMPHANVQLKRIYSIYNIYNQILICQMPFYC